MDVGVSLQPAIPLRFVGVQVVQDDVHLAARMGGYQIVHEVQKLPASSARIVARLHLTGQHVQRSKQGGGAVALVTVTEAVHCLSIGEAEKPLSALQRLNVWL